MESPSEGAVQVTQKNHPPSKGKKGSSHCSQSLTQQATHHAPLHNVITRFRGGGVDVPLFSCLA